MIDDKLKIKLAIADRVYPLTIQTSQEEGLRRAAKKIEKAIRQFEQNYDVRDKQDVLAMCALQFATQIEQKDVDTSNDIEEAEQKIASLSSLLDSFI